MTWRPSHHCPSVSLSQRRREREEAVQLCKGFDLGTAGGFFAAPRWSCHGLGPLAKSHQKRGGRRIHTVRPFGSVIRHDLSRELNPAIRVCPTPRVSSPNRPGRGGVDPMFPTSFHMFHPKPGVRRAETEGFEPSPTRNADAGDRSPPDMLGIVPTGLVGQTTRNPD